jgi:hypothetical protein
MLYKEFLKKSKREFSAEISLSKGRKGVLNQCSKTFLGNHPD